ncbi:MAG: response regulator transcription factor [Gallionella sp.]
MRILLVEDDASLGETTVRALRSQSWVVDWTKNGESVANAARLVNYDLILLDVGLPDIDGFEVVRRLREQKKVMPILMLTARDAVEDRVHGLQIGADDYLVKPFALTELLARIQALARRYHARESNELLLGKLRVDLIAKRAFLSDKPVELLPREWAVLVYLLTHSGKVVSKEQILDAISGWDETPSGNAIEVYISRLRAKLSNADISIRSIRGFGYLAEESSNDSQP